MFTTSVILLSVVIVGLLHYWSTYKNRTWKLLTQFPGDRPLPLVGNALQIGSDINEVSKILMEIWRRHGRKNFRIKLGPQNWVLLSNPVDVGTILGHQTELAKPVERNIAMIPFFGHSVSTSLGDRWKSTRKIMSYSFHFKTLDARMPAINEQGSKLIQALNRYEGKGPINVYRFIRPMMYDLFCSTLMGVNSNLLDEIDHPYFEASGKVVRIVTTNYYSYWRHSFDWLFKLTSDYDEMKGVIKTMRLNSTKILKQRKSILQEIEEEVRNNNKNSSVDIAELIEEKISGSICLLDDLIKSETVNGDRLSDSMIEEEITLLAFTGHYTTTMTLSHTLYCLAKHPEIQQQVIEEQRGIFGNDMLREPTNKDLNDMKYLENVIKETMRLIPTVAKIGRELQSDLTLKDGRIIPAGTSVVAYLQAMFMDPNLYPNPEKFDPDRFYNSLHAYAYPPFSAGPRNCIGFRYAWVAMKATLSNILRRFEILEGGQGYEPRFSHRLITESENGVQLRLKNRVL